MVSLSFIRKRSSVFPPPPPAYFRCPATCSSLPIPLLRHAYFLFDRFFLSFAMRFLVAILWSIFLVLRFVHRLLFTLGGNAFFPCAYLLDTQQFPLPRSLTLPNRLFFFLHWWLSHQCEALSPSTVVIRDSSAAFRNRSATVSVRTSMAVIRFLSHPSAKRHCRIHHHSQCFLSRSIVHASRLFVCVHLALLIRDHRRLRPISTAIRMDVEDGCVYLVRCVAVCHLFLVSIIFSMIIC